MVAVHVGQEKQPCAGTPPHLPEVYGQRCVRNNFSVDWHGLYDNERCSVTDQVLTSATLTGSVVYWSAAKLLYKDPPQTTNRLGIGVLTLGPSGVSVIVTSKHAAWTRSLKCSAAYFVTNAPMTLSNWDTELYKGYCFIIYRYGTSKNKKKRLPW